MAALALSLVPLASVAAAAQTTPCDFSSGGIRAGLVDPVPDLIGSDGRRVTTDSSALATKGRYVEGVAADGVSQAVVWLTSNFGDGVGEQLTVTVLSDDTVPSQSVDEDGGLGAVGTECPGAGCQSNQVTVTTSCINGWPQAFVVYRSPGDFPRSSADDSDLAFRDVYLRIESEYSGTVVPVRIVRPPVALVHGLWDDWKAWDNFSPLVSGRRNVDSRFSVLRINYGWPVGLQIKASTPAYDPNLLRLGARANSLGFAFNAPGVLQQIRKWMNGFRSGDNPSGWPVAAVQTDVVAHSMGGDIIRTIPFQADFLSGTFGRGVFHKIITLDTPHRGSPLATRLLMPEENGGCLQDKLATFSGHFVFQQVTLRGGVTVPGAVGDLVDYPMSQALENVTQSRPTLLRTALISGVYSDFGSENAVALPFFCYADPLALALTPTDYPALFNNLPNDGIVLLTSQRNDLTTLNSELQIPNVLHSPGTRGLGLTGTSVLESPSVVTLVIKLLNTPLTNSTYFVDLNP